MMSNVIIENVRNELTQKNELRIGINASNFLLVSHIDESGIPFGIAPDLGRIFAQQIKANPKFVVYDSPGKLADAGTEGDWDIAFVGNEPQRAKTIAFSAPYLEIPVTFLVREHSTIKVMADIDHVGNQISVMGRSAYDLFLTATIKNATII
ncbi:MAG: transporter substrate-binding domain-containing protein, partial [Burkholderiales bacterium]|nr:transporter substrate-binding domain-containing protein [Burkholderiales bacterium]